MCVCGLPLFGQRDGQGDGSGGRPCLTLLSDYWAGECQNLTTRLRCWRRWQWGHTDMTLTPSHTEFLYCWLLLFLWNWAKMYFLIHLNSSSPLLLVVFRSQGVINLWCYLICQVLNLSKSQLFEGERRARLSQSMTTRTWWRSHATANILRFPLIHLNNVCKSLYK